MDVQKIIHEQVTSNPVVLYMKGTPQMPRCGFSSTAVQILQACGAREVLAVDVLGMTLIGRWMVEYVNIGTDGLLLFALIAAVVVGLSGRWLYQQQQKIRMEETGMDKAEKDAHHGN